MPPAKFDDEAILNVPVPDLLKLPAILNSFPVNVVAPISIIDVEVDVVVKSPARFTILEPAALEIASSKIEDVPDVVNVPLKVTTVFGEEPLLATLNVVLLDKVTFPVTVNAPTPVFADTVKIPVPLCVNVPVTFSVPAPVLLATFTLPEEVPNKKLPSTVIVLAVAFAPILSVPEPVKEKSPFTPKLKPEPKAQMVLAPPTNIRLLYCLLATLVVNVAIVYVVAAVLEYLSVLPVIVLVAVVGEKVLLISIVPLLAQVLLVLVLLVTL